MTITKLIYYTFQGSLEGGIIGIVGTLSLDEKEEIKKLYHSHCSTNKSIGRIAVFDKLSYEEDCSN